MHLQLTLHHGLPYLHIEISGPAREADLRGVAAMAAAVCAAAPYRKCLIDLRAIQIELSFTDRMQLGAFIGEELKSLDKVAPVVSLELRRGIAEKVAQKVGAQLRSFTDIDEAKAWIGS